MFEKIIKLQKNKYSSDVLQNREKERVTEEFIYIARSIVVKVVPLEKHIKLPKNKYRDDVVPNQMANRVREKIRRANEMLKATPKDPFPFPLDRWVRSVVSIVFLS